MAIGKEPVKAKFTVPVVAALSFGLDLITKNWARGSLIEATRQPFIPGFLQFVLTTNTGAAFSLGRGNTLLMGSLASAMTLALIVWAIKRELKDSHVPMLERAGFGCWIGGALGNLFDRFTRGRVTDFLDFTFINFPVFNAADVLIDVGIGLLILSAFFTQQSTKTDSPSGVATASPPPPVEE
ncbi:MAG TPA: signal peptidase II [Trichormus sp.]